ncbi:tetratricopeptide repeat protein [Geomicrobium sediminis]|uniref:Tetratricopeptide (TPR) repeat protein n=1 Tax=Geomicrobium sediminis TaxID=1347788 RepID=A0ABS2PEP4_9BACL|nr:tetratricopeptide repeat protein [Geomicrobium sediminis]MBM7633905.1 tetratricopeptide (TPR) repeat protein [Geomicrobium sediminis]
MSKSAFQKATDYMSQGEDELALEQFHLALENEEGDRAAIYTNLGTLLLAANEYEDALKCYQRAIQLDEKHASAYYGAGNVCYHVDKFQEAIAFYKQAITSGLNDDQSVHFMIGLSYYQEDQHAFALASMMRAVELNREDAEAHFYCGLTYAKLDMIADAIQHFERAVSLNSEHADAFYNLGVAQMYLEQHDQAKESFQSALRIQKDHMLASHGLKQVMGSSE